MIRLLFFLCTFASLFSHSYEWMWKEDYEKKMKEKEDEIKQLKNEKKDCSAEIKLAIKNAEEKYKAQCQEREETVRQMMLKELEAQKEQLNPPQAENELDPGPCPKPKPQPVCLPESLGALSLADWINTGQVREFVGKTVHALHEDRLCYSHFNAFEDVNVWVAPLYFHSHFKSDPKEGKEIDFQMNTFGVGSGGSITLPSHFTVGGALGYYHSHLKWWSTEGDANVNGVYFGPYGAFWLPRGYISASAFGVGNFYSGSMELFHTNTHSWDLVFRFSGGYDYELPDAFIPDSSLHPFFSVDYTRVFLSGFTSKKVKVDGWSAGFLMSHVGGKLSKTIVCTPRFLLVPKLSMGWVCRTPVGKEEIQVKGLCNQNGKRGIQGKAKNQFALGVELVGMEAEGLLLSIGYGAYVGAGASLQSAQASVEWSW